MRNKNVFNMRRSLPCMSWSPKNLYNLWQRTVGPGSAEVTFKFTNDQTIFQQRWKSKAAVRAYHGDYIPEKVFKRWYLPDTLPDVRPKRQVVSVSGLASGGSQAGGVGAAGDQIRLEEFARRKTIKDREKKLEEEIERKGLAPVGSLMFSEVERRLDVLVFRSCFAHSVYEARRLVIHGYVKLNGKKHNHPNTRLAPGDMISVDPSAIRFLHKPNDGVAYDNVLRGNDVPVTPKKAAEESEAAPEKLEEDEEIDEEFEDTSKPKTQVATYKKLFMDGEADRSNLTPFYLPQYASPWLYVPAYLEVNYKTCSAIYVRHPTARPGYSEIPTPYDADGPLIRFAWEWYAKRRPRVRSAAKLKRMPEDRVITLLKSLHADRRYLPKGSEKYVAPSYLDPWAAPSKPKEKKSKLSA